MDVVNRPEKAFEFPILAEKSVSISVKIFFILEIICFWAEKAFERKIRLNFGEDLFFCFCLEITWFWAEKAFEFPSFPINSVSIFG